MSHLKLLLKLGTGYLSSSRINSLAAIHTLIG